MRREHNSLRANRGRICTVYLDEDVGAFEVESAPLSEVGCTGDHIIREVDVFLRVNYGLEPAQEERANIVVCMRVIGMRTGCDLV